MSVIRLLQATALLVLAAPVPAGAQALRVLVTEELSEVPLPGVIVEIHRTDAAAPSQATLVAAGVTSASGTRSFQLAEAGDYRVRARRIGFEPFLSDVVTLTADQTVDMQLRMPSRRVALPSLVVVGERRCNARAVAADAQVATVWEEVRKALTVSDLTQRDRSASTARMTARAFERHVDTRDRLRRLFVHPPQPITSRPFEARAPEELSESGYVRRDDGMLEFLAPDERVLLSDEFVQDHCFELTPGSEATAGLIGLAFTPDPGRRVPDIAGILWIDSTTAELRHLDFWFTDRDLPSQARGAGRSGGQVVFSRLPDGAWSPVAWRLRMPALDREPERPTMLLLRGYVEIGAVAQLPEAPGERMPAALANVLEPYLALARPARVTGIVLDSLLGVPLAGATVRMSPALDPEWVDDNISALTNVETAATLETLADSLGRFAFDTVPPGFHRVYASHADLDSAGLTIPEHYLRMPPGGTATLSLGLPPRAWFETECTSSAGGRVTHRGTIFGAVRRAFDGASLRSATVRASWPDRQSATQSTRTITTRTGEDGVFRICDIPTAATTLPVTLVASVEGIESGQVTLLLGEHRDVMRRDLVVPTTAGNAVSPLAGQIDASRAVLLGRAVDEANVGIEGATVSLFTVDSTDVAAAGTLVARVRTDSIGSFRMSRLPLGEHETRLQRMGFRVLRQRIELHPGDTTRVMFRAARVATSLGEIRIVESMVPQSSALRDVETRRRQGFGHHITQEEISRRPTMTAVFYNLTGVHLVSNVDGDFPGLYPGDGGFQSWILAVRKRTRSDKPPYRVFEGCALTLYVDGFQWSYRDLANLTLTDMAVVEVFTRAGQVPARYPPMNNACGVVLVWTVQAP